MNWLEKGIAGIAPGLAVTRAQKRIQLQALKSYDAAKSRSRNSGWSASSSSANDDLEFDLETIRDRARDMVRNNEYATKAINSLSGNMIGTGIRPRIHGDKSQEASDLWNRFAEQCDYDGDTDFGGLQMLAARSMMESGEAIILRRPAKSTDNLAVPMQYQVLESDHLDGRKNEKETPGGGKIIQGVELDAQGKKVAYWLFKNHPGGRLRTFEKSQRVDARFVIHLFEKKRAGQLRDVSWFAPVMLRMRDLADYDDAELLAKKIQACFGMAITQEGDEGQGPIVNVKGEDNKPRREEKITPGMIARLNPGEDVKTISPSISPGYGEYTNKQLHAIAAGLGITYEMMTGDFSQVNYSSFRGAMLDFQQRMNCLRTHLWIPRLCKPIWNDFATLSATLNNIDAPAQVKWTPPKHQSVDPIKDYKATLIAVRSGLKSLQAAASEYGEDPQTILAEIEEMNETLDEKGIVLDSDPRQRTINGGSNAAKNRPNNEDEDDV